MKHYITLYIVLALWCAIMPNLKLLTANGDSAEQTESEEKQDEEAATHCFSADITELSVYIAKTNTACFLSLEDYVAKALTAVMAEDAPAEALKAQAVAIRSFALYNLQTPIHKDYDLCGDPYCCYPIADTASQACVAAAEATENHILCYEGAPVMALSHLSSCISTEGYGNEHPYLGCVRVEDESGFACYKTVYTFQKVQMEKILSACGVGLSSPHTQWFGKTVFTAGNRVATVEVGDTVLNGKAVAAALGLDSLCFTVNPTDTGFTVICYGSGSGYGMSRCSAMLMAANGADYGDILMRFYPNTVLARLIFK